MRNKTDEITHHCYILLQIIDLFSPAILQHLIENTFGVDAFQWMATVNPSDFEDENSKHQPNVVAQWLLFGVIKEIMIEEDDCILLVFAVLVIILGQEIAHDLHNLHFYLLSHCCVFGGEDVAGKFFDYFKRVVCDLATSILVLQCWLGLHLFDIFRCELDVPTTH